MQLPICSLRSQPASAQTTRLHRAVPLQSAFRRGMLVPLKSARRYAAGEMQNQAKIPAVRTLGRGVFLLKAASRMLLLRVAARRERKVNRHILEWEFLASDSKHGRSHFLIVTHCVVAEFAKPLAMLSSHGVAPHTSPASELYATLNKFRAVRRTGKKAALRSKILCAE